MIHNYVTGVKYIGFRKALSLMTLGIEEMQSVDKDWINNLCEWSIMDLNSYKSEISKKFFKFVQRIQDSYGRSHNEIRNLSEMYLSPKWTEMELDRLQNRNWCNWDNLVVHYKRNPHFLDILSNHMGVDKESINDHLTDILIDYHLNGWLSENNKILEALCIIKERKRKKCGKYEVKWHFVSAGAESRRVVHRVHCKNAVTYHLPAMVRQYEQTKQSKKKSRKRKRTQKNKLTEYFEIMPPKRKRIKIECKADNKTWNCTYCKFPNCFTATYCEICAETKPNLNNEDEVMDMTIY